VRTTTLARLAELAEGSGAFDVLIVVGVLEHIRDLATAMTQIRRVLAPGGIVYVEVPDALTFTEWPNAPFQDFSTEHINFFAPRSLANLMGAHGFAPVFSEQNARQQSYKTVMSNVSAVFRKEEPAPPFTPVHDAATADGLQRYVEQSRGTEARLHAQIDRLADEGTPVLVWGIGTHTSRLLATSRLREANIQAFVESNARYQGRELDGVPIIAPEALRGRRSRCSSRRACSRTRSSGRSATTCGCPTTSSCSTTWADARPACRSSRSPSRRSTAPPSSGVRSRPRSPRRAATSRCSSRTTARPTTRGRCWASSTTRASASSTTSGRCRPWCTAPT
jgi:SAM-dependent methyltransferase